MVAGGADGFAESVKFHYPSTDRKLNLNDKVWNPDISWRNKYKRNDPALGEKFPGSTTIFVFVTDGYHRARMVRNVMIVIGIAFKIGHRQKWYLYLVDMASCTVAYSVGFNVVYEYLK